MTEFSSYVIETLWEDEECVLSRRVSDREPSPHLALTPASARQAPESVTRLEHAYALRNELDSAWAARPVALEHQEGRPTLSMEDPGGEVLAQIVGRPWDLTAFLRVGIGLAVSLGRLHARGMIHKDIKPVNILVNRATGGVWLTGFGIASRLPRERQAPAPPEVIAGTFAYMAPEQTGRMNRSIDSRSDLYSLGVTLYEMLTGTLPFTASDPMEWIHCHIARQPVSPTERVPGIPVPIAAIVMKLLAKNAEDRYQTAAGVEADLRKCLFEWKSLDRIDPFSLGAQDVPDQLLIPEKLYGREREIHTLLASFDRVVVSGTPELVLVSGYCGIGKSSVVNELHKLLVPPRGLFASGKFDQYRRDIPYSTLAQGFEQLIRSILGLREVELGRWRDDIRQALGPNGQLIVNLIPRLELVIGPQPPVPDLPPKDAQNRFQMVFRRFIGVFARPEHPLVLFLDDLQWLDAATLDLFEHLVTEPELHHLLLVGAYRDNEVDSAHPLMRRLEAIDRAGASVHRIVLAPLGLDDLSQLIADTLHCDRDRAQPLAQLVEEKTSGNPFFAIQFIAELDEDGFITFDREAAGWTWNLDRIRAKNYTDNVVDLMVGKLHRLSRGTQDALRQLSCLGSSAQIATLRLIYAQSGEEVHDTLGEAVRAGLVFRLDAAYAFLHDRVQEAAYSLIPEAERAAVHLRIARLFIAHTSPDKQAEMIFEIVNQFNLGTALITDWNEKRRVAELNLHAGRRAKASAAYASACTFLSVAMALLGDEGWTSLHELTFAVWLEQAECEFLSGNVDIAERLILDLLNRGVSTINKAAAYRVKIDLHVVKSENAQAIETALECLRLFGIDMPAHPTIEQVQAEYDKVWKNLAGRPIESLIDLPLMTDQEMQAAMRVLSLLWSPANIIDARLSHLNCCQMVNLTLQYGVTDAAAHGFGWFGMFLGPVFRRYTDGYRFGKLACDLVEKYSFHAYRAKTYIVMEIIALWTQPIASAIEYLRAALRAGAETGDLIIACYSHNHVVTDILLRGDPLEEVWLESERSLDFDRKARFRDAAAIVESQQRFLLNMRGKTSTFSSFSDSRFEEVAFEAQLMSEATPTTICWYWIIKLQARFISGDYDMALAASRKAKELLLSSATNIQLLDYHYYTALTIAAIYNTASPGRQREWREELTVHLAQLREWAENGSATFLDKFELVSAEIARVEGRQFDAEGLYEQAIRSAREQAFVQNEGLANELAAQFYAGRGFETIANAYLRNARYCYLRWGADGKVRQLDQMHSHLREEPTRPRATSTTGTAVEHLDLATVIKVSQAVSGEIVLEKLVQTLMVIALEHAGAERGLLILPRDEEMRVEAEATTGHDTVEVCLRQAVVTSSEVPESILHYVMRTQESVLLDDALAPNQFSADEYIRQKHSRSVLCLPLVKQAKLTGVLYLENNLTSHVFTRSRIAVLNLLASQAAISLENARLYTDMQQTEVYLQAAQRLSHTGSFGWHPATGAIVWSEETYRIVGYDPGIKPTIDLIFQRIHPEDIAYVQQTLDRGVHGGTDLDFEHRFLMPDGSIKYVHIVAHALRDERDNLEYVGSAIDVTEQHQARAALEKAFTEIKKSEDQLRIIIDTIPTLAWCALRDGSAEFLNQRWHDYTGLSAQEAQGWGWTVAIHPEDSTKLVEKWRTILASGEPGESEARMRRFDGEYRWFLFRAVPLRDERGNIVRWYGTNTDIEDRKGAEEALRSNAQSFRLIVDSIPGLVCTMTAAGEVELVNRQILEYFGKTFEALKGWATSDGVHPHDLPRVMAAWMRSIETGQPYDIEHRIRRADGIYRWFHVRALPQRDTEGRIVRWHVLLTDIDDRKKAEEKLRRSEASLLDAQRLSRTGSWTHDFLSGTVTISPETVRMWGIQTENDAAVTDFFLARMHPEDRLRVEQAYREAQLKKADFESDFRIVLPDGTIKDIHSIGRPIVSEAGDIVEFIGAAIDITERKRAEQRLMVQHTVTQMLAEAATLEEVTPKILQTVGEFLSWELGVLWSIDREAGVLRCVELWHKESVEAPQFEAISRESTFMPGIGLPGRVWSSHEPAYIPDVVRDANFPRASIAAREGLHAAFGFPILLGGDVLGVMEFFSHEIRQPEPELLNMMATIGSQIGQFIEGKRAEEKLHKAQAELAHVTRVTTMGELTASIAHEVNQPLAAVVTNANACLRWLAGGPPNLDEARDAVGRIVRDGNRAADVIARIRALARKTDPEKARLDINETVQEIILLAQSEAGHKGVALRMELAADLPPVLGDRVQLQQVILNLVMNGIEATASVTDRRRELLISSRQHGLDRVLVAVQDSGIGIERQNLEKIFDPFYTTKSQGMGMGLAISRSIIENHGGRLWAVPNEGAGAIFQFTLLKYQ